jgi:SIR2-like domain
MIHPELKRLYREGRVIPFIGAGASMSVRWKDGDQIRRGPSWSELVDEAAKLVGFDSAELLRKRSSSDMQILEYCRAKQGLEPLHHWLTINMRPPDEALRDSLIHKALANLDRCPIFYTTNFDDLLERSFALLGRNPAVISQESNARLNFPGDSKCEVVKFHGDLRYPKTMVVSEQDFHRRMSFTDPMDSRLLSDLLGRVILFIGYSFKDPNVSYLFYRVWDQLGKHPDNRIDVRAYILVPDPSDFEKRLFAVRHMNVIEYDGAAPTEGVAHLLEELRQ